MEHNVLVPYLVVIFVFLLLMFLSFLQKRKLLRLMEREVQKSEILCELTELQHAYDGLYVAGIMNGFPIISTSLKEIPIIVKKVGYKVKLENIRVVPVSVDPYYLTKMVKLIKEREEAPGELKELLDKKLLLVNKIAMTKHPWTYYWNRITSRLKLEYLSFILKVLISVFKLYDKTKSKGKGKNEKYIVDTYPLLNCN